MLLPGLRCGSDFVALLRISTLPFNHSTGVKSGPIEGRGKFLMAWDLAASIVQVKDVIQVREIPEMGMGAAR
jgi:hypothetical protein